MISVEQRLSMHNKFHRNNGGLKPHVIGVFVGKRDQVIDREYEFDGEGVYRLHETSRDIAPGLYTGRSRHVFYRFEPNKK